MKQQLNETNMANENALNNKKISDSEIFSRRFYELPPTPQQLSIYLVIYIVVLPLRFK